MYTVVRMLLTKDQGSTRVLHPSFYAQILLPFWWFSIRRCQFLLRNLLALQSSLIASKRWLLTCSILSSDRCYFELSFFYNRRIWQRYLLYSARSTPHRYVAVRRRRRRRRRCGVFFVAALVSRACRMRFTFFTPSLPVCIRSHNPRANDLFDCVGTTLENGLLKSRFRWIVFPWLPPINCH